MNLNSAYVSSHIDSAIRFLLYVLIFWLPYSPAVVETCVILSFILFLLKRTFLLKRSVLQSLSLRERFSTIASGFLPRPSSLNHPIGIFLCIGLISIVGSDAPMNSLHRFFTKTLEWFVVYFLVLEVFYRKEQVQRAVEIFLLTSLAVLFDGLWQYYVSGIDLFRHKMIARGGATASFNHANSLGAYLLFVIPLIFAWGQGKANSFLRILGFFFFSVAVWLLFLTFSRGALMAIFVGAIVALLRVNRKLALGLCLIGILSLTALFVFSPEVFLHQMRLSWNDLSNTFSWRLDVWYDIVSLISFKPFFGYGINNFMTTMQVLGEHLRGKEFYYSPVYAHNCFLQIAFETGLCGLAAFCFIFFKFFKESIKAWGDLRNLVPEGGLLGGALTVGVISFLTHSFVDTDLYSLQLGILFWFMVGLTVSVLRILAEK